MKIKDTGKGVSDERLKFLFTPFAELKKKQSMQSVVDYGIGLGLSCSKEIANAIGGDVQILNNTAGNTIF